jgi:hypothetical protein
MAGDDHRDIDRTLGQLTAQMQMMQALFAEHVRKDEEHQAVLMAKIDELMAAKNRGIGVILVVGGMASIASAWFTSWLQGHPK